MLHKPDKDLILWEKDIAQSILIQLFHCEDNVQFPRRLDIVCTGKRPETVRKESTFPKYLTDTYEIANPLKMIKNLAYRGFIEEGSAKDVLPNLKLTELKELASSLGINVKGKKADIIEQLSVVDEKKLGCFVKERTWKLSEKGQSALKANPYIQYFTNGHP